MALALVWWLSDNDRSSGPSYAALRRVGGWAGATSHPMWLWAGLFTISALLVYGGLWSRRWPVLFGGLVFGLALMTFYTSVFVVQALHDPHASFGALGYLSVLGAYAYEIGSGAHPEPL